MIFLGTAGFAGPSFEALLGSDHDLAALVTQPDRSRGRGRRQAKVPPLKPIALQNGVPVLQPPRVREADPIRQLRDLTPDVLAVVAYGQILPRELIDLAPHGAINVHGSLLPRYRGAAPIQWALANGDATTGVTTMQIDEGLDTGPMLLSRTLPIGPRETATELEPRLAQIGADLLLETLAALEEGSLKPRAQDESEATLAPRLRKEDGLVDWKRPAEQIERRTRAFVQWPGSTTSYEGRSLKLLAARPVAGDGDADAGTVTAIGPDGIVVTCGGGTLLCLERVQPESRRPMPAADFARGARLAVGATLG